MREFELRQRFNYWNYLDIYAVDVMWVYSDICRKTHYKTIDVLCVYGYDNILDAVKNWLKEHHPEYSGNVFLIPVKYCDDDRKYPIIHIDDISTTIEYDIAGDWLASIKLDEKKKTTAYLDFHVEQLTRGRFKRMFSKNIM